MNVPYPSHSLSLLSLELFFSSFEKNGGRRMRIEREWSGVEWWGILTAGSLFITRRQAEEIKKSGRLATSWKFLMLCGKVHPTTNGAPRLIATCCYDRTISLIFCYFSSRKLLFIFDVALCHLLCLFFLPAG